MKKLSIIIPVFNEEKTIYRILEVISQVELQKGIEKEVIIINDASKDDTENEIMRFRNKYPEIDIQYSEHRNNLGKGAAIHSGIGVCTGDYLIIQDADLEYDPHEYNLMLEPALRDHADVVYGSRFKGSNPHRILFFWHSIGNFFLTFLSNLLTNLNLSDMESCYKLFKTDIIKKIELEENRFGFEPEITAKISRIPGIRIYEIGVSYYGRTYHEGKKINWKDGIRAIYCILKYNIWAR